MRHEDQGPPGSRLLSLSLRPRVSFTQRLARTSDSSVRVSRRVGQTRPVVDVSDAHSEDAPSPSNGRQSYGHRVRSPTFERRKGGRRPGRAEARRAPQKTPRSVPASPSPSRAVNGHRTTHEASTATHLLDGPLNEPRHRPTSTRTPELSDRRDGGADPRPTVQKGSVARGALCPPAEAPVAPLGRVRAFPSERFHALFNSLFKVLFTFPSRYLFAIGLTPVCSFRWSLPPVLGCIPKQPDSWKTPRRPRVAPRDGVLTLHDAPFQATWARTRTGPGRRFSQLQLAPPLLSGGGRFSI